MATIIRDINGNSTKHKLGHYTRCIDHPEWGTFGIAEDHGDHFVIRSSRGSSVLDKSEAAKFWDLA